MLYVQLVYKAFWNVPLSQRHQSLYITVVCNSWVRHCPRVCMRSTAATLRAEICVPVLRLHTQQQENMEDQNCQNQK